MGRRPDPKPRKVVVIRYHAPDGRRCKATDPGAVRTKTLSDSYYLELPGRGGARKERIALETSDLAVAWVRTRDILDRRYKESLGILDDRARQAARPIAEHVEDWLSAVAAGGVGAARVGMLRTRVTRLVGLAKWSRITDIRKSSCQQALAALQAGAVKGRGSAGKGRGASAQTRNHHLGHARQFTAWLADEGRLTPDPLAGLKGVSVASDRRHDRRVPGEEEVRVLFDRLDGLLGGPARVRLGMTGPQRALGYQVAMCAGLRAGELRRLTPASFDLGTGDVRITGASDKARKRRVQALPRWLCDKLRGWLAGGGGLWEGFPAVFPGRLLHADLDDARAAWIADAEEGTEERRRREASAVCLHEVAGEEGPLYWDFHSCRHWYITELAGQDGISPSTLLAMARHSDPKLTMNVYGHAKRGQVREAAEQLARPGGARPTDA